MKNGSGTVRRHRIALIKARKAFELYVSHYGSYQDIADHPQVKLTRQRVHQIIAEGMKEVVEESSDLRERALDMKLHSFRELKREARQAFIRACPVCRGVTSEQGADPCEACADTGYFYELNDRMKAADRYLRAMDQESRLLGEYADDRLNVTVNVDLLTRMASLPEDELDEIIAQYSEEPELDELVAGIEDAEFEDVEAVEAE